MNNEYVELDGEEIQILKGIEDNEWQDDPLSEVEKKLYQQYADYTLTLQEKKATQIDFTVAELAFLMAKAKEIDVPVGNIVQTLVRNYAAGKIRIEL
jgi:catalase